MLQFSIAIYLNWHLLIFNPQRSYNRGILQKAWQFRQLFNLLCIHGGFSVSYNLSSSWSDSLLGWPLSQQLSSPPVCICGLLASRQVHHPTFSCPLPGHTGKNRVPHGMVGMEITFFIAARPSTILHLCRLFFVSTTLATRSHQ